MYGFDEINDRLLPDRGGAAEQAIENKRYLTVVLVDILWLIGMVHLMHFGGHQD